MEGHDSGFACWQATAIRNNETQFLLQGHLLDDPTDLVDTLYSSLFLD